MYAWKRSYSVNYTILWLLQTLYKGSLKHAATTNVIYPNWNKCLRMFVHTYIQYISCVCGESGQSAREGEGHSPKSLPASQCGAWALATLSAPGVYVHHNPPHNNRPRPLHMSTDTTSVCRDTRTHTQSEVPQVECILQPHHYTHINTITDTNTPSNINVLHTHSSLAC